MSVIPQHKYLIRYQTQFPATTTPHDLFIHRRRVICSATTPRPIPNQLTTDPTTHNSNNPPRLTISCPPLPNDPTLQSTWSHRAWVAGGCTTVLISLAKAAVGAANSHIWLQPILAGYVGYILADLGSGVYHWGIDNYGDASTPVFGTQIEAFQGHHKWPWTITKREFANNLHALARAITFFVLPLDLAVNDPVLHGFICMCSGCIMFSQQFHAWAHSTKSKLPPLVVALQDMGLLVSRSQHGAHHRPPYNNNYCIVSGVWNEFLDNNNVFEALEMALYFKLGVRPRSWSEPNSDWIEEVEASPPVSVQ
ncbi:Fatty acid desaturase 4, chloroplastic [Turnera subulata]|uniref:Fatty acid desaturase 4, chloroplastic n=1 Tax=Turnera subulata TaxID=218843 RepID=A0A9Q0JPP3_9ROSI|nr:Fatty acid desaturase 4, chloroplastic [Turnera subulata]